MTVFSIGKNREWRANKLSVILFALELYVFLKIYRDSINYLNTQQGGIWNLILALMIVVACISFLLFSSTKRNAPISCGLAYALTVYINGLISFKIDGISALYNYMVAPAFVWMLWLFFLFRTREEKKFEHKITRRLMLPILAFLLYVFLTFVKNYAYWQSGDVMALTSAYYALCMIPFFLKGKKRWNYICLALSIAIVFLSNKRAGLVALAASFVVYYFVQISLKAYFSKKLNRIICGAFIAIVGILAFVYIDDQYQLGFLERMLKIKSDGGSGRTVIYTYVWNEITSSDIFDIIFGHGVSSMTKMDMHLSSAHSDFLNILYEYGVFSLILLCFVYLSLFAETLRMIKNRSPHAASFAMSIVLSFCLSIFSANLDSQTVSLVLAAYWGTELADWNRYKEKLLCQSSGVKVRG